MWACRFYAKDTVIAFIVDLFLHFHHFAIRHTSSINSSVHGTKMTCIVLDFTLGLALWKKSNALLSTHINFAPKSVVSLTQKVIFFHCHMYACYSMHTFMQWRKTILHVGGLPQGSLGREIQLQKCWCTKSSNLPGLRTSVWCTMVCSGVCTVLVFNFYLNIKNICVKTRAYISS